MGAVTFSIDTKLVSHIQKYLNCDVFVETGTFEGKTIESIYSLFSQIYTIELNLSYYQKAQQKFADIPHIHVKHDNAAQGLQKLRTLLQGKKILYWLDAHCLESSSSVPEQVSQCSLLEELKSIKNINLESIIMIDDARFFLAPPTQNPHYFFHHKSWPTITEIIDHLRQLSDFHDTIILNDVIIFYPNFMSNTMMDYGHKYGVDWSWIYSKAKNHDQLIEKEGVIQHQHQLLHKLQQELIEKEGVIQHQHQLLQDFQ
jgi:hypothetical protein